QCSPVWQSLSLSHCAWQRWNRHTRLSEQSVGRMQPSPTARVVTSFPPQAPSATHTPRTQATTGPSLRNITAPSRFHTSGSAKGRTENVNIRAKMETVNAEGRSLGGARSRVLGEPAVDGLGDPASLGDGPHHQRLAACHVAGGE